MQFEAERNEIERSRNSQIYFSIDHRTRVNCATFIGKFRHGVCRVIHVEGYNNFTAHLHNTRCPVT